MSHNGEGRFTEAYVVNVNGVDRYVRFTIVKDDLIRYLAKKAVKNSSQKTSALHRMIVLQIDEE